MKILVNMVIFGVLSFGLTAACALFMTPLIWFLWNWVIPEIFGLPEITIWQTIGLMLLVSFVVQTCRVRVTINGGK